MIEYPYDPTDWVKCGCCGGHVRNTPEHNVALHQEPGTPYPNDDGHGMCKRCGGDPDVPFPDKGWPTEEAMRKRLGWGQAAFYDARIELVRNTLNDKNRERFEASPYAQKVLIVREMIEKGVIKW